LKLEKLYELIIQEGIKQDPRGGAAVKALLAEEAARFAKLDTNEKDFFDQERLRNPYADTRLLNGKPDTAVKTVIVGIDMEVGELVLVDRLREKGKQIDLVITHHPAGSALANFYEVMALHTDIFAKRGIAVALAESLTKERIGEVSRSVSSANHMQQVDAARLLGIPFMCMHTVADNHVATFLQKLFDTKKPRRLKDILKLLRQQPEYREAARMNAAPFILQGSSESEAGKILVDMTGGTEGSRDIFGRLVASGISTLVCMHLSESHFKRVKEERINIINAGHIASDNLGINLLLDAVCRKEKLTVLEASGFRRFVRR